MSRFGILCVILLNVCLASAVGQESGSEYPPPATISFTFDFPQGSPSHYSIAVDSNGHSRYECVCSVAADSEPEAYESEFEISEKNRNRIFDWAKQAKYFNGKIDSGKSKMAFTGTKTLNYQDGRQSGTATYNYSTLEPVQELTSLFQKMQTTLDYGHRLAYFHHYQKLALDDELKRMVEQAHNDELAEIPSVAPVLREIFDDNSVINVVRARAKELLDMRYDGAPWK